MSIVSTPVTFLEAGIPLHEKLLNTAQADKNIITPTPLLIRVLRRTALDFADIIVDGRCATGTNQVGSAAAIWVHNTNNRANVSSVAVGSSSTSSPQQTSRGSPASSRGVAGAGDDVSMPLYGTEAALNECRSLLVLYTLHCLLSANQELSWSAGGSSNCASAHVRADADGRVHQLPLAARNWAPEVSIILAETEESAMKLHRMCSSLGEAYGLKLNVVLHIGNKTPASLVLPPTIPTMKDTVPTECHATSTAVCESNKEEDGSGSDGVEASSVAAPVAEQPYLASIVIATAQGFLGWNLNVLLSAGVDVAVAGSEVATPDATSSKDDASVDATAATEASPSPEVRRVYPHIASIVVEEMGGASVTSPLGAEKAIQQWRGVHQTLYTAVLRQNPRYVPAVHLHPHYMWVCRGPISCLPATLRQCFSRRSRRYYQIQPSTYISPLAVSLMPRPHEGLSSPAESLGIRLVLSQNQSDKEAQLRRIVTDRSGLFHRVLLLTHNKEVAQLSSLIASWGVSKDMPSASTVSCVSSNSVLSTRRMDSLGAQQQCHTAFLKGCEAVERLAPSASSSSCGSPVVVTLVAWDALTSLDIMDVDVIIQYYPPQKSLTNQEWAEFIQILHTTIDGEREIELSLRQNRNNKEDNILSKLQQLREGTTTGDANPATKSLRPQRPLPVLVTLMVAADFTLSAYFLYQYMYSGATGILSRTAMAASLTSTSPVPGRPGVQEPVESPLPVLDISPKHPYFIPLVCGHTGDAEWPVAAPGSPPQPRASVAGSNGAEASLVPTLTSGEAVTVKRVLAAKLQKEQLRVEVSGGSSWDRGSAANSLSTSGNPSAAAASSLGRISAQGNSAAAVGGEGSNLNPSKSNSAATRGHRSSGDENQILAKLARCAGAVDSSNQTPSAAAAAGGSAAGGVRFGEAINVRANNRGGAGTGTCVADSGSGSNGKNQRLQQRGGGGNNKESSSPTRGGGSGSSSGNRNSRSSAPQNSATGGRTGNSGRDLTNPSSNGSPSSITSVGAPKAAATATSSDNGGRGGGSSKKEVEKGSATAQSPLTSKSGASSAAAKPAVVKDSGSGGGGDAKSGGGKRRSRNSRGKKQQPQSSPSSS